MEPLNIQIRHDGTRRGTTVHAVRALSDHRDSISGVFPAGLNVGMPLLERFDFDINAPEAIATVTATFDVHATSIEVIADLVVPIPGRSTARVYVLSNGLLISTRVHDAENGEPIACSGVRLTVTADACHAWLTLLEPTAIGPWHARTRGKWHAVEVVEREVRRDVADVTTWRVRVAGDISREYELHEFDSWEPAPPAS